ncbi:helix-turn-helix transcriptional regulator [Rhizobium sp. AAP43]|uniref:helix-turn-helix transcriptional regulator n=1 Tax=Rhizobium sp. AAP43 TaxID=1523420 RepID=UPI0006B9BD6B|nr:helix-turn-helix transcriptional regulator [Rhizobium sp. AAP43]
MIERMSGRISRFTHVSPGIGAHCLIIQATSGTFRRLRSDQPGLIIVRHGMKSVSSDRITLEARPGEAIVLPMNQEWTVVNEVAADGDYKADALVFSPELVMAYTDSGKPPLREAAIFQPDTDFESAVERAGHALAGKDPANALCRHLVGEIIVRLDALGMGLRSAEGETLHSRVRSLVAGDLATDWSTSRITSALGVSEATLRRKLAFSGTSLTDIIADMRMTRAVGLLQATELPINQVALAVGYESASKFAARFRERFGLSPRDIRISALEIARNGAELDRVGAAAE